MRIPHEILPFLLVLDTFDRGEDDSLVACVGYLKCLETGGTIKSLVLKEDHFGKKTIPFPRIVNSRIFEFKLTRQLAVHSPIIFV